MGADHMVKRSFSVAPLMLLVMLISVGICGATSSNIRESHNSSYSDHPEEQVLLTVGKAYEEYSGEFSMESEISRRLLQTSSQAHVTDSTDDAAQPAVSCGDIRYKACLPDPNAPTPNQPNCGVYNRECPR